jgi:uncharacterized protein YprB with RNaseH-like and TPR domain
MNCFAQEMGDIEDCPIQSEKTGFLDIEASNLHADFGYVISYCIKELDGDTLTRVIKPSDIRRSKFDKGIMSYVYKDLLSYDRVVVYYGKDRRFDLPFLRTRCLHWGHPFPSYRELFVTDAYDMVKGKLRLSRSRLANACSFYDIPCKAHTLKPDIWQKAMAGNKDALDYILQHNIEDVESLELLWKKLNEFAKNPKTSV